jgi:hypothetical protein
MRQKSAFPKAVDRVTLQAKTADTDVVHPVRQWLRLWRDERIEMLSSLPVPTAVEQLADVTSWRGQLMRGMEIGWGSRIVVGEVSQRRLRLTAMRLGVRNSFSPVLRGELIPTSDGCVLIGTIGWHPAVRVFTFLWVSMWAAFFLTGVVGSVGLAALGDEANALGMLAFAGVDVGLGAFFVGLLAFGGWMGRKDEEFLREWLSVRLQPRS